MSFAHLPAPSVESHRLNLMVASSLSRLKDYVPIFESEDDDDDEDPDVALLEDLYTDRRKHLPCNPPLSAMPASKKALNLRLSNAAPEKPSSKLVAERARPNFKKSNLLEQGRSTAAADSSPIRLSELRSSTWEDRAYAIARAKKLREATIQQKTQEPSVAEKALTQQCGGKGPFKHLGLAGIDQGEVKTRPMVEYLLSLGLNEEQLEKISQRHDACLYVKVDKAKDRLGYLTGLGVKTEDLSRIILRHPQVLEYTVESMMKPRVQYLQSIGVPDAKLGRVLTVAPSLLECSLEGTVKPRVRFLIEEVGINSADVWKVVVLSPQVLTHSINNSLRPKFNYLVKKLGIPRERAARMITKHPQLLHYSLKNGIERRVDFLRSIGIRDSNLVKVLGRSTQILSLSVEKSLKPKWHYLTTELDGDTQSVVRFPAYFSLSLECRIQPRHMFLKSLNRLPEGVFPLQILVTTDLEFCERWAKASIEEYNAFRKSFGKG